MKPIPSCPGYYADDFGSIYGPRGRLSQFARKGYFCVQAAGKQRKVSRLVCEAYHGPAPSATHHAAHLNSDSFDNRPNNLAWKIPAENCLDIINKGSLAGEKHPRAKLSEKQVRYIREQKAIGVPLCEIHSEFPHVKYGTLVAAANRRNYRYV